jgi:sugar phosphate permease
MVGIATLALLVTNGLTIGGLPVFYKPMIDDLQRLGTLGGQSRSLTSFASSITFWSAGIFVFFTGMLISRVRLRILLAIGCVILGSAMFLYSRVTSPIHVYVAHFMFGVSLTFAGLMVNSVLIANWFRRLRGTAMGIVITGTSLGSVLIPLTARPLIERFGWRMAMLILSGLIWFVLLPLVLLAVREFPRERGLSTDGDPLPASGDEPALTDQEKKASLPGLTLQEALRTPDFWVFALCAAMLFYSILVVVQQIILYLQTPAVGMSLKQAAFAQSMMGTASIGGKLLFGWLCDRIPRQRAFAICCGWLFMASLVLLNLTGATAFLFLIAFGLGSGGAFVTIPVLSIERFGPRDVGKLLGAIAVAETMGGATGLIITGVLARTYDFTVAFYGVVIAAGIAFVTALLMRRQPVVETQLAVQS